MKNFAKPGFYTKQPDDYGAAIFYHSGAKSAPYETYQFPGFACMSVNNEIS
ncbi:hypothetical protein [Chryseobacterium sp. Leaf180]|uniref:hypothetical protein n=1 Tax=Chryseobacterium sp. Leaf180 TaxID=1736289 RepID=UPI000AB52D97|nr:hypothetical protein [Chryseobacterium sp. Leaf180]